TARVADCSPPVVAGWLALDEGTPADAEEHGHAALALAQERDTPWFVLVSLELLASATAQLGSHVESRRLTGAAQRLRHDTDVVIDLFSDPSHLATAHELCV